MRDPHIPVGHLLLGLAVVLVWGTNFVVIRIALDALPPLAFATLRFALVFLPAALLAGARGAGAVAGLVMLPLAVPLLIFGAGALTGGAGGLKLRPSGNR